MKFITLLALFMLAFSCAKKVETPDNSEVKMNFGFEGFLMDSTEIPVDATDVFSTENYAVKIKKEFLNKDFLMTAVFIEGPPVALGNALRSKVVYFEEQNNEVYLFEKTSNILVSDSIPTKKLLANFPIVKSDETSIVFDFNKGMKRIMMADSYYGTDFSPPFRTEDQRVEITNSYMEDILVKDNILFINQYLQAKIPAFLMKLEKPVQVKYTFRPYRYNKDFPSKVSNKMKKVGYFEVDPIYESGTGRTTVHNMKFDISKPVTYYISPNVPKEYHQAIKDGVLYWNKAFKKEVLKVAELPEGVTPHTPGYNIIQWLDYEVAGFAYADMLADPFTGELLQTHVYMTSVFAVGGLRRASDLKLKLKDIEEKNQSEYARRVRLAIKGFDHKTPCRYHANRAMHGLADVLEHVSLNEKEILRFSQDYVADVIAHEIGHTLGLRHNFAGNLASNVSPSELKPMLKEYLETGKVAEDKIMSSSVMDYLLTADSVMQGAKIRLKQEANPYDIAAIEWGYTDKKIEDVELPLFCTDSKRDTTVDCKVWDQFNNTIEGAFYSYNQALNNAPIDLALSFLKAKAPFDPRDKKAIQTVALSPKTSAVKIGTEFKNLIDALKVKASYLSINEKFSFVSDFNQEEIKEDLLKLQSASIKKIGGIEKALTSNILKVEADKVSLISHSDSLFKKFEEIISSDDFVEGTDLAGNEYQFSAREILYMNKVAKKYFKQLDDLLLKTSINILAGGMVSDTYKEDAAKGKAYNLGEEKLEEILGKLAHLILTEQSDKIITSEVNGKNINHTVPLYKNSLRKTAIKLYQKELFPKFADFSFDNKKKTKELLKERLKKTLTVKVDDKDKTLKSSDLPRPLRSYILKEEKIVNSIP